MKKFDIDYDEENDSLFAYSSDSKSSGAVEAGNFVFDLDTSGNLVSMEVLDVSEFFKMLFSKAIKISNIKEFKADIVNFRNTTSIIKFSITTDLGTERNKIVIPRFGDNPSINF